LPESVREQFWEAVRSGVSPTAAATVVGVSGATGRRWARDAGWQTDAKHYGLRYPRVVRDAFWESVRSGYAPAQAAQIAGVSEHTARRWVAQAGYVPRSDFVPRTRVSVDHALDSAPSRSMSFVERCRLENLLEAGCLPARAAGLLGRHRATISRETRRGATGSGYRARVGQDVADVHAARPKPRKLDTNLALLAEVLRRLKKRNSPEQIAGRLRQDFPEDPEMWVSHETIYQAMYVQPRGELAQQVKAALRTGRTRRKHQGRAETDGRGQIRDMVNISDRPAEADDRAVPGHWEGDLIIGANGESAIGTLVERTTGFVMLLHLPEDRTAATTADAMTAKIPELPGILWRSLTWDQGKEMARHTAITEATGLPIYFCDPHSPWQRGTNENTYWCIVLMPRRFDGSRSEGCWVTRRTRAMNGFPLICPQQPRARALTGSDLIEAC
jgi:IS30 family transposase/transposase